MLENKLSLSIEREPKLDVHSLNISKPVSSNKQQPELLTGNKRQTISDDCL